MRGGGGQKGGEGEGRRMGVGGALKKKDNSKKKLLQKSPGANSTVVVANHGCVEEQIKKRPREPKRNSTSVQLLEWAEAFRGLPRYRQMWNHKSLH